MQSQRSQVYAQTYTQLTGQLNEEPPKTKYTTLNEQQKG
jgi:hypothetical protein